MALFGGLTVFAGAAEIYHTNRAFTVITFAPELNRPAEILDVEGRRLTNIVIGTNIVLDMTNTCAIEKQAAIPIIHVMPQVAWQAAVDYSGSTTNYPGKIFDNVGWVRGTTNTPWGWSGAYLWVIQNKIVFRSSTTEWWQATSGVPAAIDKVLVGSLGDYDPATINTNLGPSLVEATNNFPGADSSESKEFQVDLTNVFYRIVVPLWITPRSAYACAGGANVQFTVSGTNIPQGVTWSLIPNLSGSGGAQIQSSDAWQVEITLGNIAGNYKVRATSIDNTDLYDEVDLIVFDANLEIYKPKIIDPNEEMIPDSTEMTTGSVTFVNLDNDDNDSKFDYNGAGTHDDVVAGGDDELVKVKLKLKPASLNTGTVKLMATEGGSTIAVRANQEKSVSYLLGTSLNVPGDFTVEGESLVKTQWVEGIAAHTTPRAAKLKMEYTAGAATSSDEAALTVVGIERITWQGRGNSVNDTDTLDADPNWPAGLGLSSWRVFPDARMVGGSVETTARDKVGVEVALSVAPPSAIKLYLKSFDVDDPTSVSAPVDDENNEEDNRSLTITNAGQFSGEVGGMLELVFAENVQTTNCEFQVTMQPGDNFRVVASGDKDFLAHLENRDGGLGVGNADKQRIVNQEVTGAPEAREVRQAANYASDTLTVWRFLHVEVDSMAAPPTTGAEKNTAEGNITAVSGNGAVAQIVNLSTNLKTELWPNDYSSNLTAGTGNGRFENGWIKIGAGAGTPGETMTVNLIGNGDDYVRKDGGIDIPARVSKAGQGDVDGKVIAWSGSSFTLNVFSGMLSTNYNGGILNVAGVSMSVSTVSTNGVNTVTVVATQDIPFVLHDDDDDTVLPRLPDTGQVRTALAEAYVQPLYDVGDTNTAVGFVRNVLWYNQTVVAVQDWDSKFTNASRFWIGYILSSFQGHTLVADGAGDRDPNTEGQHFGYTATDEGGCLVFIEVHRSTEGVNNPVGEEMDTVVHEIGHALGRSGTEPVTDGASHYTSSYINSIRNSPRPWP